MRRDASRNARACSAIAALVAALAVAAPAAAWACECDSDEVDGSDPTKQLTEAVTSADAIFIGHVRKSTGPDAHGNYAHGIATLRVTEVFKGALKVGSEVELPAGNNGGDCSLIYEPDSDVLVYANGKPGSLGAGHCSRTRTLQPGEADLEIQWLRSGRKVPLRPVALQRERVTCGRCTLVTEGARLTGATYKGCCGAEGSEMAAALRARRPFWTGGHYQREDPIHTVAVGIARDGSAFQLVETGGDRACTGHVEVRTCGALEPDGETARCVSPGPLKPACDEKTTRQSSMSDVETLGATGCIWRGLNDVGCSLPGSPTPLKAGAASWPRLVCTPGRPESWSAVVTGSFLCNIVAAPESGGPSKEFPKNAGPLSR